MGVHCAFRDAVSQASLRIKWEISLVIDRRVEARRMDFGKGVAAQVWIRAMVRQADKADQNTTGTKKQHAYSL